jgi:hypothetical protein
MARLALPRGSLSRSQLRGIQTLSDACFGDYLPMLLAPMPLGYVFATSPWLPRRVCVLWPPSPPLPGTRYTPHSLRSG